MQQPFWSSPDRLQNTHFIHFLCTFACTFAVIPCYPTAERLVIQSNSPAIFFVFEKFIFLMRQLDLEINKFNTEMAFRNSFTNDPFSWTLFIKERGRERESSGSEESSNWPHMSQVTRVALSESHRMFHNSLTAISLFQVCRKTSKWPLSERLFR